MLLTLYRVLSYHYHIRHKYHLWDSNERQKNRTIGQYSSGLELFSSKKEKKRRKNSKTTVDRGQSISHSITQAQKISQVKGEKIFTVSTHLFSIISPEILAWLLTFPTRFFCSYSKGQKTDIS